MNLTNHLLNTNHQLTEKNSGAFKSGLPDTIIIHYTAGSSAESSIRTLTNPKVKASAHLVIGRDGEITQLIPFNKVAWHAGKSSWGKRNGLNQYSIGIELDNAGVLTQVGEYYQSWFGRKYDTSEVIKAVHRNEKSPRYWHTYTEEQLNALMEVCELLVEEYNIKEILGHEEISPSRKIDPGPAFPLDKFRQRLLQGDRSKEDGIDIPEEGIITASALNVRIEPDAEAEKLREPLPKNTKVKILKKKGEWYKVSVEAEGWVSAKYVNTNKYKYNNLM